MRRKPQTKKQEHGFLLRQVKEFLQWHHWKVHRIYQSQFSEKGLPDLFAMRHGMVVWIEIKTGKDVLSDHQIEFYHDCFAADVPYHTVRSLSDAEFIESHYL